MEMVGIRSVEHVRQPFVLDPACIFSIMSCGAKHDCFDRARFAHRKCFAGKTVGLSSGKPTRRLVRRQQALDGRHRRRRLSCIPSLFPGREGEWLNGAAMYRGGVYSVQEPARPFLALNSPGNLGECCRIMYSGRVGGEAGHGGCRS